MQKKRNSFLIAFLAFAVIAVYGFLPVVKAASLTLAQDTLSNSTINATNVTHAVSFTTGIALTQGHYMEVALPTGVTNVLVGNVTCPANTTASVSGAGPFTVKCTVDNGQTIVAGAQSISIGTATNPGTEGDYTVDLTTKTDTNVEVEKSQIKIYFLKSVTMNATVLASLSFAVAGVNVDTYINGVKTSATTTATTTPFGTLPTTGSTTVGQQLTVSTNASNGYKVTVQQDHELRTAGGATINSFRDSQIGAGSTTAAVWQQPANSLGSPDTYGHMGLTSDDTSLSTGNDFGGAKFKGLNGNNAAMEVMYHNGPANGTITGTGVADVAYTVSITALQEAGDYSNVLTYVCTPQY